MYSHASFPLLDSVKTTGEPANTPSPTTEGKMLLKLVKVGCFHSQEIIIHYNKVD